MFEILLKETVTFYELEGEIVKLKLNLLHKLSLVIVSTSKVSIARCTTFLMLDVIILIG